MRDRSETMRDLKKIIDELEDRKKQLDLDSPERQLTNRMLTGLRYSYELREQRKLDPRRQDLVRRIVADHPEWDEEALQRLHDDLDAWGE
jgi:hypothetical protein